MGIFAIRFIPWALIFSTPSLAAYLSTLSLSDWWQLRIKNYLNVLCIPFAFYFFYSAIAATKLHGRYEELEAINFLPKDCHLFASPLVSGAVTLYRPDVKIFIDGRNDYWGINRYLLYNQLTDNPTQKLLSENNPNCAITEKASGLSLFLRTSGHWKLSKFNSAHLEIWEKNPVH